MPLGRRIASDAKRPHVSVYDVETDEEVCAVPAGSGLRHAEGVARVLIDRLSILDGGALREAWRRRGAIIYGEDEGPRNPPLIADLRGVATPEDVESVVRSHNDAIDRRFAPATGG